MRLTGGKVHHADMYQGFMNVLGTNRKHLLLCFHAGIIVYSFELGASMVHIFRHVEAKLLIANPIQLSSQRGPRSSFGW
jgi:hypothetical protein